MSAPSIYQLEYSVENLGKHKEESKRCIRWAFQVDQKQHEVQFTWSINSGKQNVTLDGENVLSNKKKSRSVFDEIITQPGETPSLRVVCSRTAPNGAHPSFRCYELLIDDKPFHTYPQLGAGGDYMEPAATGYDGPMSILDVLFPGQYGAPPSTQFEMEDDMYFPGDGAMVVSEQTSSPYALPMDQVQAVTSTQTFRAEAIPMDEAQTDAVDLLS